MNRPNLGDLAKHIEKTATPQILDTANSRITASEEVAMGLHPLGEIITPLVLESTPDVLTVGRRCAEEGFGFHWEPFSTKPYFILPGGTERCVLESIDNVPYLRDTMNALPGGAFPEA